MSPRTTFPTIAPCSDGVDRRLALVTLTTAFTSCAWRGAVHLVTPSAASRHTPAIRRTLRLGFMVVSSPHHSGRSVANSLLCEPTPSLHGLRYPRHEGDVQEDDRKTWHGPHLEFLDAEGGVVLHQDVTAWLPTFRSQGCVAALQILTTRTRPPNTEIQGGHVRAASYSDRLAVPRETAAELGAKDSRSSPSRAWECGR